jgi:hypothetical protein
MITGAIDEEYDGIPEDPESDDFLGDDDELGDDIEDDDESEDIGDDEYWAYLEKADRKYKESKEDN